MPSVLLLAFVRNVSVAAKFPVQFSREIPSFNVCFCIAVATVLNNVKFV